MARMFVQVIVPTFLPNANPRTMVQIVVSANTRVVLHSVEVNPGGSTGASAPLIFDLIRQGSAGTGSALTAEKVVPEHAETQEVTFINAFSAEPTDSGNPKYHFTIHQTGTRLWVPQNPFREQVMEGGTRWGIRYVTGVFITTGLTLLLEE